MVFYLSINKFSFFNFSFDNKYIDKKNSIENIKS